MCSMSTALTFIAMKKAKSNTLRSGLGRTTPEKYRGKIMVYIKGTTNYERRTVNIHVECCYTTIVISHN